MQKPNVLTVVFAGALFLVGLPAPASAQTPLTTATGNMGYEYFGHAVSAAGDVDADGVPDFVVGADAQTTGSMGRVWIYSGATHELLHVKVATLATNYLGASVAPAGDFNLDGRDDVLVGAPGGGVGGVALVLSGLDGSVLHTFAGAAAGDGLGEQVSNAGDVNGDGRADLIVGAPYRDVDGVENVGAAVIFSGADASLLRTFVGGAYNGYFGSAVDGIGDVDGDGFDDVAVGERGDTNLWVFSGADGHLIRVHGSSTGFFPGREVAGIGDVDGDLVPDYAAGSPNSQLPPSTNNAGRVRVYSGLDGSVLHEFFGQAVGDALGSAIDGAGDVDQDGVPDILIGTPQLSTGMGRAEIYSGATWSLLQTFRNDVEKDSFGKSVAGVGDTNGDGVPDVLIGFNGSSKTTYRTGAVRLYSGLDFAPWYPYCDALPNSSYPAASLAFVGSPSVSANDLDLVVTYGVKGMVGLFLYGPAQQQTPFGNGNLCVGGGGVGVFRLPPFVMFDHPGFGGASLDLSQPPLGSGPGQITPGSTWNFQAWFRDTPAGGSGFNLTNALSATFLP